MTIKVGGRIENTVGSGDRPGVDGTVLVTGENSVWANSGDLYLGREVVGHLTVEAGGQVTSSNGTIGFAKDAVGAAMVSGADALGNASTWENAGILLAG
ncbi:MAG: hypothetical protein ACRECY_19325 [Phyllobacterium sp.]